MHPKPKLYIAVHGGAGLHGQGTEKDVKRVLREACLQAMAVGSSEEVECPSLSMVETATMVLEDDPVLNAGYGSNLTLDGNVECDAAIMAGHNHKFGSVGAVSGFKNPIKLARAILEYSTEQDKLGRIPPLTLVSQGATSFIRRLSVVNQPTTKGVGPLIVPADSLVSPTAQAQWKKWKDRLDDLDYALPPLTRTLLTSPTLSSPNIPFSSSTSAPSARSFSDGNTGLHDIQDTVGAVSWHPKDGASASVSSGGLMLKLPGRVGEAAVYGAGCWAQHQAGAAGMMGSTNVACSVSGTGEYIVRSSLARLVGERALAGVISNAVVAPPNDSSKSDSDEEGRDEEDESNDTHQILQTILKGFWEAFRKEEEPNPSAGILLLTREVDKEGTTSVRLWCAFTTPTMAIAYASPNQLKPKAVVLRHPDIFNSRHMADKPRIFITAVPL